MRKKRWVERAYFSSHCMVRYGIPKIDAGINKANPYCTFLIIRYSHKLMIKAVKTSECLPTASSEVITMNGFEYEQLITHKAFPSSIASTAATSTASSAGSCLDKV